MQQQPVTMQPNANFGNGRGATFRQNLMNPYHNYANYNYCNSFRNHISNDHANATFKMPGPNHNHHATHQNPMGGSMAGAHTTLMPEQGNRKVNHGPQPSPTQVYLSWRALGFQRMKRQHEAQFKGQYEQQQQQQQKQVS